MTLNEIQSTYIKSGLKPIVNARATQDQFSVLAGIYATTEEGTEVLCLSTGVKCVPDIKLQKVNGMVLHDSHAEILTLRSFNYLMLDLIEKAQNGESNTIIELDLETNLYKLKVGVKLHMYISELPCGDASLESFIENDAVPWDMQDMQDNNTIRGRSNYTQVGKVRTKPGRKDSPVSLSKSCSDKLTVACIKGILNSTVQDLFQDQIFLTSIILPEITESVIRCFKNRLPIQFKDLVKTEIVLSKSEVEFEEKLKESKFGMLKRPQNNEKANELGIIYIPVLGNFVEVVNLGVKNGNSVKRVLKTKRGLCSVSRMGLMNKRKQLVLQKAIQPLETYSEFKKQQKSYMEFKLAIKKALGEWGKSTKDDFEI